MEEITMNDNSNAVYDDAQLIVVTQLPVIEEQLQAIKQRFIEESDKALALACTEDTLQVVRNKRSELSHVFDALETKRKEAKKEILAPYEAFEAIYKECVTDIYRPCDAALAKKIHEVEDSIKAEKRKTVEDYFTEYAQSKGIDFISFDRIGVNVTMTVSKKNLKERVKAFLDKVADELALIETQEYRDEILVEYKASLNAPRAITLVTERHKAIEEERRKQEAQRAEEKDMRAAVKKVEEAAQAFAPPKVESVDPEYEQTNEKIYEVSFRVRGTIAQIKALKRFIVDGGYEYDAQE